MIKSESTYCLYRHIRPDKNEPFYIGIGTEKRSKDVKIRNKYWRNVYNVNNGKIEIEILIDNLTWKEACIQEVWWIKLYGRHDLNEGSLVNMTNGGEGAWGRNKSKETLQKFKNTMDAKGKHHMKDYKHTDEAKKKIAEAGKRKKSKQEIDKITSKLKGREKTTTEITNWRISRAKNKRKIINTQTGEEYSWVSDIVNISTYTKPMVLDRLRGRVKDKNFPYKYKD